MSDSPFTYTRITDTWHRIDCVAHGRMFTFFGFTPYEALHKVRSYFGIYEQ